MFSWLLKTKTSHSYSELLHLAGNHIRQYKPVSLVLLVSAFRKGPDVKEFCIQEPELSLVEFAPDFLAALLRELGVLALALTIIHHLKCNRI